jgi:hypothetical protein
MTRSYPTTTFVTSRHALHEPGRARRFGQARYAGTDIFLSVASPSSLIRDARRSAGLTQGQLAERAGTSQAAIARYESATASPSVATLERILSAAGKTLTLGVRRRSSTNLSSPQARALRRHRHEVLALAKQFGASNVRIFGSVARGDTTEQSDIDLLVDIDVSDGLLPLISLGNALEALLEFDVDVTPSSLLKPDVAATALADAIAL